jgi:hypothetical protein
MSDDHDPGRLKTWLFAGVVIRARQPRYLSDEPLGHRHRGRTIDVEFIVSAGLVSGRVTLLDSVERPFARMFARQIVQRMVDRRGFIEAAGYGVDPVSWTVMHLRAVG